jgi:rod shape-determining protein MreC
VADLRLSLVKPLRTAVAALLYPAQWLVWQPVHGVQRLGAQFESLESAQRTAEAHQAKLIALAARAGQVEQLTLENNRLRALMKLASRPQTQGQAAQVLYDAADPYTRKVVIDRGMAQGVEAGAPVLDESGVVGQVTRVHPLVSEVTLLTDRDQAIPVLNTRTGVRSVAYGQSGPSGTELELRFMAGNADVQEGDLLSTSGVDGVYPAGLPVARVTHVERRAESAFARVLCVPIAQLASTHHLLVLAPLSTVHPPLPMEPARASKGTRSHPRER